MADIHAQMEANGLPTKFETTSEKPANDVSVMNINANVANAEAVPNDKPESQEQPVMQTDVSMSSPTLPAAPAEPAPLESSTLIEPLKPAETSIVPDSQPAPSTTESSLVNGDSAATQINGHAQPSPPTVETSFTESVVPSSIPSEIPSSVPTVDTAPSLESKEPIVAPVSDIPAATQPQPTSDLRSPPHSDALPPKAVAEIAERKHEEDNQADRLPTPSEAPASLETSAQIETPALAETPAPLEPTAASPPPPPEPSHVTLPSPPQPPAAQMTPAQVPEEKPAEPAPTLAVVASAHADTEMTDAPATKVAREREEDNEPAEPSAKRVKTDVSPPLEAASEFKVPQTPVPTAVSTNGVETENDDSVTPSRLAHMKKTISNLKKSKISAAFRLPVDHQALNIPTYPEVVKQPMDLGSIDQKLKNNQYTSVKNFTSDFGLIVNNCLLFNGKDHSISQQAMQMQQSFNNQMSSLPPATATEPSKAEKKAMKLKTEPIRAAPPRRQSVTTPSTVKSPKSAVSTATPSFAPGPDGVPLIRRDSSIVDGRPKRAIVPTKRNSDFAGVRPKKKKYELQLRFCQEVHKEIISPKHWQLNQYFTHPVDPVALNIPTYFQVIKKPMDLGTIQTKLENNQYEKAKDYEEDVRLVFKNCYKFNPEGDYVNNLGRQLEELFNKKWEQKDDWIAAREPQSEPSEAEEENEEEEGSEEEGDDSDDERNEKIKQLQAQIEAMSKQMGELTQPKKKKKSTPPTAATKKSKSKPKKEKPASTFPGLIKAKDKKKPASKPKAEKDRYVTFAEKQYISNGIGMLPERQMQEALKIIQASVPSLANSDGEIELDIEEVPNHALIKLLNFVKKYAGPPPDEPEAKQETYSTAPAPTKSKKNKPMSKTEQEAQIQELNRKLDAYQGGISSDAVQSVEGNDSSDDSGDSEESEEE